MSINYQLFRLVLLSIFVWLIDLGVSVFDTRTTGLAKLALFSVASAQTPQPETNDEIKTVQGSLDADGPVLEDGSHYKTHSFEGEAGQVVVIELISDEFDAYLLLLDPEGNKIAEDDDSAGGNNARITVTLPATGTYKAVANSSEAGQTGEYSASLRTNGASRTAATGDRPAGNASRSTETKAEADRLFQQGIQQLNTSQFREALQSWEQALQVYREIGDRQGEANSLGNLGVAYFEVGQYDKAIDLYQQCLAIAHEIGDRQAEAYMLGSLGNVYNSLGQYEKVIDLYQQSLAIAREIGNRQGESASLSGLGNTYYSLGQYDKAIDFHQQSLAIKRKIGDRKGEALALSNLGATLLASNQFAAATEQLFTAAQVYEALRSTQFSDAEKRSFYDTQANTFRLLQQALIAQNDIPRALEVSERGRARAFVELLASQQSANGSSPTAPPLPTVAQIQQIAKAENATLVQYSMVSNELLYIWVIKPTGEIDFRQVPLGDQTQDSPLASIDGPLFRGGQPSASADTVVSGLVNNTRSALRVGDGNVGLIPTGRNAPENRLRELHQLLIEPIADLLPADPNQHVIFVPHQSLFLIPFAALKDANGKYLIEQHTILTAPSIQTLALTQRHTPPSQPPRAADVLVVGNPTMPSLPDLTDLADLPAAKQEAETIARLFDTQPLLGAAATETQVVQQMAQAQIIHLATHGLLQYGNPQASGISDIPGAIVLAPSSSDDGLLTAAEIFQLKLKAQLIVLSACDTGRGDITGDGVVGLSRAMITAGVPSVIVSLWAVPDAPTSELMSEFYRQWQTNPDKAQALRQAMLTTMRTHPDPRDWAAFTLIGAAE